MWRKRSKEALTLPPALWCLTVLDNVRTSHERVAIAMEPRSYTKPYTRPTRRHTRGSRRSRLLLLSFACVVYQPARFARVTRSSVPYGPMCNKELVCVRCDSSRLTLSASAFSLSESGGAVDRGYA